MSQAKPKRGNPESQLQKACIVWFATQHRALWESKRLHAIPNGGHRSKATAANMKAEGQVPGVWDLFLSVPRGGYGGMWIEMKAGKNKLTDEQRDFLQSHKDDYWCSVCYTLEEFMWAVSDYLDYP